MFLRVLTTAVLAAGMAVAQQQSQAGAMNGGHRGDGDPGNYGAVHIERQSKFDQFAYKLKLTKDQKTEAQTAVDEARTQAMAVQPLLLKARQDLATALVTGADTQAVNGLIASYGPLAAQVAGIEAKVFARIYATLSRNQQSKAAQTFPLLAESVEEKEMGGRDSRGGGGR
jgi:hypothetical protein